MDFNFSLPKKKNREDIQSPRELEIWTPVEERPGLNNREMSTILNEDQVINTMHIVIPSFLTQTEDGKIGYYPCFELNRYFIAATLRQSPYLVFYEERKATPRVRKILEERFLNDLSKFFLVDAFFTPMFGGIMQKYFLFQRATFETVPEAIV